MLRRMLLGCAIGLFCLLAGFLHQAVGGVKAAAPSASISLIQSMTMTPSNPQLGEVMEISFKIKNTGATSVLLQRLGVAAYGSTCALDGTNCAYDVAFPWQENITIAAGQEWTYTGRRSFYAVGSGYIARAAYLDDIGSWYVLQNNTPFSVETGLVIDQNIAIHPQDPVANQWITASFMVRNAGTRAMVIPHLSAGVHGPNCAVGDFDCGQGWDFPIVDNISLSPGQSYAYSARRTISQAGPDYFIIPAFADDKKYPWWYLVPSWQRKLFTVDRGLELVEDSLITPQTPLVGESVRGTFKLRNMGSHTLSPLWVSIAVRGPNCLDWSCQPSVDFPAYENYAFAPGQELSYQKYHSFDRVGSGYIAIITIRADVDLWYELGTQKDFSVAPGLELTQNLALSPTDPYANQAVTATYTVRNAGTRPIAFLGFALDGRGPFCSDWSCNKSVGYMSSGAVTLDPGQEYTYRGMRNFDAAGKGYFVQPTYENLNEWWRPIPGPRVEFQVDRGLEITEAFVMSPATPLVGEMVTATFKLRNMGSHTIQTRRVGVGSHGPNCAAWDCPPSVDFPWIDYSTIEPGQELSFHAERAFDQSGAGYFAQVTITGIEEWWYQLGQKITFSVAPGLEISELLTLSPSDPVIYQNVTARFSVRNAGTRPLALQGVDVIGRGPNCSDWSCSADAGFVASGSLVLQPGEEYHYQAERSYVTASSGYFVQIGFENGWCHPLGERKDFTVDRGLEVTSDLILTPPAPQPGIPVKATFKIRNMGSHTLQTRRVGVGSHGPNCVAWECLSITDFPWVENMTFAPGQELDYSQLRSFEQAGAGYFAQISVQLTEDFWIHAGRRIDFSVGGEESAYQKDFSSYKDIETSNQIDWDIWDQHAELALIDGENDIGAPVTAVMADGSIFVVWSERRGGVYQVYAQKLDSNGQRLWQTDKQVSQTGTAIALADNAVPVSVVVASGNRLSVTWCGEHHGTGAILAQDLDVDGNRVWPAEAWVSSDFDPGFCYASGFDHTVDSNGDRVVVWTTNLGGVRWRKVSPDGIVLDSISVKLAEGTFPAIAAGSSGVSGIAWVGANQKIFVQRFNAMGAPIWGSPVVIDTAGVISPCPNLIFDDLDNIFLIWNNPGLAEIDIQKISSTGILLWSQIKTVGFTDSLSSPGILFSDGILYCSWVRQFQGFLRTFDKSGNSVWSSGVMINDSAGRVDSTPAIAPFQDGNVQVVWRDRRTGNTTISAQKISPSGARLWTQDAKAKPGIGAAPQRTGSVAFDSDGNLIAAWRDLRADVEDVYLQKFSPNGSRLWANDLKVNTQIGQRILFNEAYPPSVAVGLNGNIFVTWNDSHTGNADIYAQLVDPNGNRLWNQDLRVNSDAGSESQWAPSSAYNSSGNFVLAWIDNRAVENGGSSIYAQVITPEGLKLFANDKKINASGVAGYPPVVAVGPSGNAYIAWLYPGSGQTPMNFHVQKLSLNGALVWANETVISISDYYDKPALAVDGQENIYIAWHENDIYAQKIDANGQIQWGSKIAISSFSGYSPGAPVLAATSLSSGFLAAWIESPFSMAEKIRVKAARFTSSGTSVWAAPVQVIDTSVWDLGHIAAAYADNGESLIAWDDLRNSGTDVYMQRISAVGDRVWSSDLQVVNPDRFYYTTGSAQSKKLNFTTQRIYTATLTADVQTHGGQVRFYLSNSGGAQWEAVEPGVSHTFAAAGSDLRWKVELSAALLWPRSPVINSLRVEYSFAPSNGDAYEVDNACEQAREITANGAKQEHSFHVAGDEDWVWFSGHAGVTYTIEADSTGSPADAIFDIKKGCQQAVQGVGSSFGSSYTFHFTALADVRYSIRVYNQPPDGFGPQTTYRLSVRALPSKTLAIIVAGHKNDNDSLQPAIDFAADRAYRLLLQAGVAKTDIYYLGPDGNRDVDNNGLKDDITVIQSTGDVGDAIQAWAPKRGAAPDVELYLYMVDHGVEDAFMANGEHDRVSASDLNRWLTNLESNTGINQINVVIEACRSGSFINISQGGPGSISGPGRVIITSTSETLDAYSTPGDRDIYFSNVFFTGLSNQKSLLAAFQDASQFVMDTVNVAKIHQSPWLDDNGDHVFDEADGGQAASRSLIRPSLGGSSPEINSIQVDGSSGKIAVEILTDSAWANVRVEVYAPSFNFPPPSPDGTLPVLNIPTRVLTDANQDGVFEGTLPLTETGTYRLVIYVEDGAGNMALPKVVTTVHRQENKLFLPLVKRLN